MQSDTTTPTADLHRGYPSALMIQIGDRATFAAEVGARTSRDLRTVDLWAAGKLLTTDDNAAFVAD